LGDEAIIPCRSILPLSVVNHPNIQSLLPLIGNLAYIGIASGFLMTDMLQLRILLVGGYTGLVAYHILRPVPLRIPLRWSAVFVLVNAGAACLLLEDRYMAPLTEEEEELYQEHFSVLTRGQFYQLLQLSTRVELNDKTVLTVEGVPCPTLYFIQRGQAKVYHSKDFSATIESGGFVNDVSFQRGENVGAYGTVVASGRCSALVWDQEKLRQHLVSRPEMDRNLKYMLSNHLVKSLLRQREARHLKQRKLMRERHDETSSGPPAGPLFELPHSIMLHGEKNNALHSMERETSEVS
jgi:CRP-like cAMP-binding protein